MKKIILAIILIPFGVHFVPAQETVQQFVERRIEFETEVFAELNTVRANPPQYASILDDYRMILRGNVISLPSRTPFSMFEGASVIEEAAKQLRETEPLQPFSRLECLDLAAAAQLKDLLENKGLGHFGKDGAGLGERLARFGKRNGMAGENITYLDATATQVAATMLIDDGVPSRLHRNNVLSPQFLVVGIACGTNGSSENICVTIFAREFGPLESEPPRLASVPATQKNLF